MIEATTVVRTTQGIYDLSNAEYISSDIKDFDVVEKLKGHGKYVVCIFARDIFGGLSNYLFLDQENSEKLGIDLDDTSYYMNIYTGTVDTKDGWDYINEQGLTVNAVDLGEVVKVIKDQNGDWIEA